MGKISKRMKRMLAIILVEVIVASNVFVSYADEYSSDEPKVIAEMTEEEADQMAEEQTSEEESSEEESSEESSEEESSEEESSEEQSEEPVAEEPQDESGESEGENPEGTEGENAEGTEGENAEGTEGENPEGTEGENAEGAEATPDATASPTPEATGEDEVIAVLPQPEDDKEECVCENKCTADAYNTECPVCKQAETAEDAETFLKDNCKGTETDQETEEGSEKKEETKEAETVEVDNSVKVTAVCKADGKAIEEAESVAIAVDGTVDVLSKAPSVEGYTFANKVTLENGEPIVSIKKETTEEKEESEVDGKKVVTKITKTTSMSYSDGTEWKELTEDITVVYEYTKDETEEQTESVVFTAVFTDKDGKAIEGITSKPLTFEDTLDLTKEPEIIENYVYVEARINETVVSSINKKAETDENGEEVISYSYTAAGEEVEVTENTEVTLVYEAKVKEAVITLNVVDEKGLAIEGYDIVELPEFESELVLDNPEKAPVTVEGYLFKEATVDGTVITTLVKEASEEADAVPSYSYITKDGQSVTIEEDTEITLSYEEEELVVSVDASIVDEFGDEIAEKYTGMDITKIFGDADELKLNDPETPPVAKVQVRKGLFKVIKYTYTKASVDKDIITGLKRTATKDSAELADKEKEYIYSYTTDGENWTKIKKDTTVIFEYSDGKKSVYTYEDANVLVTATLQHANAIPDDAEFVVTPVTPSSSDYNYDAYMDALNKNADKIDENADSKSKKDKFNEKNTLLYDIAFLAAPVDENGETIEGDLVEYQPAEGMVNISVQFKQKQLEKDLKAEKSEDVTVIHMPLSDSAKEANATTASATDISSSDVKVEVVDDSTSVSGEQVNFNLSDFSLVVFALNNSSDEAFVPGTHRTYADMLGSAKNIGVVANEITLAGHLETNLATGSLHGYGPLQAPRNEGNAGETYIGAYDGGDLLIDRGSSNAKMLVYTTIDAARNFGTNTVEFDKDGNITKLRESLILDTSTYNSSQIASMVSTMVGQVGTNSSAAFSESTAYDFTKIKDKATIDIAGSNPAPGTYYVNFDAGEYTGQHLNIKINSDQNVILNIPDTSVSFGQYTCAIDGNSKSTQASTDDDPICQRVIFNCPNATFAKTGGVVSGTFIVPNATFVNDSVAAGWLVAKKIDKIGGQEWHCVYHGMPEPVVVTDGYKLSVRKTVNNAEPDATENGKFTFSLYRIDSEGKENFVESKTNNGGNVEFSRISTGEHQGDFWYAIKETGEAGGYTIDETVYYAKVTVISSTSGNSTNYSVASIKYYRDAQGTDEVSGVPTFNNTKAVKGSVAVTKAVSGTTTDQMFYFVLKDINKIPVAYNGTTVFSVKNNETVTISDLAPGTYTLEETDAKGKAVSYNGQNFPYEVSYTSQGVIVVSAEEPNKTATITNTYKPEKTQISGFKEWKDNDNQDGLRPASITVTLYANGKSTGKTATVSDATEWKFSFTDLPKYADGQAIKYTVGEQKIDGYTSVITGSAEKGYTITNTHNPGKTTFTVQKFWYDKDDQDGKRLDSIQVQLFADNEKYGDPVTLNKKNDWKHTWTDLDVKKNSKTIVYSVAEITVSDDYVVRYDSIENGVNISNTHTPETITVSGSKTWKDNNNQDGKRPESIIIYLKANGVVKDNKTVTEKENWSWSFTNLPRYANGIEITYSIEENVIEGYTPAYDGYNVTNTYTPEKTEVRGSKIWEDANNQDGKRPASITVNLLANGEKVDSKTVRGGATEESWSYEFTNLDKYKNGKEIIYTVSEEVESLKELGYSTVIEGTTITNSYTPGKTTHKVVKAWDDNDNQDGLRPGAIEVQLLADGIAVEGSKKTLDESNGWSYTWENLELMKAGKVIEYTAEEVGDVKGYTTSDPATANSITTITNKHTPETTAISGKKTWDDAENQDGIRPSEVTIILLANDNEVRSTTATQDNDWAYSFTNLPVYENGQEITYSIKEISVDNYTTEITGFNVKNTHVPETTNVSGSKIWNDSDNQDGKRPASITVNLLADGKEYKSLTVTPDEKGNWKYEFTDLPKYKNVNGNGVEIVYTVTENAVKDYSTEINGTEITNSYTPGKTSHSVQKTWNDSDNQDGKRPVSIEVELYADGIVVDNSKVTLNEANNWSYTWDDLDLMSKGKKIVYTAKEVGEISGYTVSSTTDNGKTTITNSYAPEKTSVSGSKTWTDDDNRDGKRPTSITIRLLANGNEVDHKVVTEADNWSWSFTNLPKYAAGSEIQYTITEDAVAGYEAKVDGYNVTNTHTPEKISVSGEKTWDDADNQDGLRPESIVVNLLANGEKKESKTVTADDGWKWTFSNLDKYADGVEIDYTITEEIVSSYTGKVNGFNIVNSYTPGKTSLSVKKVWSDAGNQDGIRPATVKVQLYADGKPVEGKIVELNAGNGWIHTWKDLDEKKAGQNIVYTAQEVEVPAGYTVGYNNETQGTTVITNTHIPELIDVEGSKEWNDNENQDGKRPASITVNLLANGKKVSSQTVTPDADGIWKWKFTDLPRKEAGTDIVYTVTEEAVDGYTVDVNGYNITNTHTPEKIKVEGSKKWIDNNDAEHARPESITIRLHADSKEIDSKVVTADANGDWKWSFTDLDKYANGKEIIYTITEDFVFDYTTEVNGYDVTNTYTPGETSITVTKEWYDNDNQDGKRPASITVQLYEDFGIFSFARGKAVTLSADNNWTYTWNNLPVKKQDTEVKYWVKEISRIAGYETDIINGTDITITNVNTPETTKVKGEKIWDDNKNQDGARPESITVRLIADEGTAYEKEAAVKTVTAEDNWKWIFENLPKYRDGGIEIVYTVKEDPVAGYEAAITGNAKDGFKVTNSRKPEKTEYSVKKVWDDSNNQDGIRPETITVQLYAGDVAVDGKTAELNLENAWSYTWTELDKYSEGKLIVYTAKEVTVPDGYTMNAEHNVKDAKTTITNTHIPEKTSISGSKTWNDADNQDGVRPASITINLLADGKEVAEKTVTAAEGWSWSFTDLPKYNAGKLIEYTISEDDVEKYISKIEEYDVTNTYIPETVEVSGSKTWNDANNQDGKRPARIEITLSADGVPARTVFVTAEDNWSWSFTDLPKFKEGVEINYTVSEKTVEDYTTTYDGYNVINSYTPGKTSITVTKAWNDANNQDGIRPETIKVQLYANDVALGEAVSLNTDNNWSYTWSELDKMSEGENIKYTVKEVSVPEGYTSVVTGDAEIGYVITNTHVPVTVDVNGKKTWKDAKNQDGIRPESITINLYAGDVLKDSKTVTEADGWKWSFTDLPKYADGKAIAYRIEEVEVKGYTSEITGFDVENTHIPETISIEGTKTWTDEKNKYEARPEKIVIRLYADGEEIEEKTIEPDAEGNWPSWKFENLDKYKDGKEIVYTISEDAVTDYTPTVTGYNVENKYTPDWTEVKVTKIWEDNNNQDGIRPAAIMVQLYEDKLFDKKVGEPVKLDETNGWTYTWINLPKSRFLGEIDYTIKELGAVDANGELTEITGYTTATAETTANNVVITNTHIPELVDIAGNKVWEDNDNQDGLRPEKIVIRLFADGIAVEGKVVEVTPDEKGDWSWSFIDLPKYKTVNGITTEIAYTVTEDVVAGYSTEVEGHMSESSAEDGVKKFTVYNTHTPETIDIEGTKTWNDGNNQDGIRPAKIVIHLFANGTEINSKEVTEADGWKWSFTDLPKYKDGAEIVYTITEDTVEGYSTLVDGYNVINDYTPEETSRTVNKIWQDSNNRDNIRPTSITVQLYADGEAYGDEVILNAGNGWSYTWENLPEKKAGVTIVYTVVEIGEIRGYTTSYSDDTFVITNTHTPREEPEPTPPTGDEPTPEPEVEETPDNRPTPDTPDEEEVLGAKRVEEGGAVLGARRGADFAVLGKRRRPQTGDSMALIIWVIALATAAGGAIVSLTMMHNNKKRED